MTENGSLQRDDNDYPVMGGTSSSDDQTIIDSAFDPITRRLLVDDSGTGGGFSELTATGTVNGINTQFQFSGQPTYIVSDGVWLKSLDNNSGVQWTWNSGTGIATMVVPPISAIFGILNQQSSGLYVILPATGLVDDSNTAFSFTEEPLEIVINGASYASTGGAYTWTWNGVSTATLSNPVGTGGSIYGRG